MNLNQIHNVFFIGIGGIGMSALARYFKHIGKEVQGYDLVETELTRELENEGIPVYFDGSKSIIPESFKNNESTLVVFTPAVPDSLPVLVWYREQGFRVYKRSRVLGLITKAKKGICVAGTHGKTTVSTMMGHLLKQSKVGCSAFLGGISKNYNSNLLVSAESDRVVVEADEFDRSFHQLSPNFAIITSVDADHLDIYGTKEALKEAFQIFTSLISIDGLLLVKEGIDFEPKVKEGVRVYNYGFTSGADFYAENISLKNGLYSFDLHTPDGIVNGLTLGIPGRINLENAVAASSMALLNGVSNSEIREALLGFKGIRRRFEPHIIRENLVYIDDYAHHPAEIDAAIMSAKDMFPDKKLSVVFQPHLYSRTSDFAVEFAASLSKADEVILLDIYPAREIPMPGVSSSLIYDNITIDQKYLLKKEELIEFLASKKFEFLLSLGAGDIGALTEKIEEVLLK